MDNTIPSHRLLDIEITQCRDELIELSPIIDEVEELERVVHA